MNENFNEIQDRIDSIITAARLIGYKVKNSSRMELFSYTLEKKEKTFSIIHYKLSNRVRVIESGEISLYTGGSFSHNEKIKALEDLIQRL